MKSALAVILTFLVVVADAQVTDEYLDQLVADAEAGKPVDWRAVRNEMHERHERATSSEERAAYIAVWYAVMMAVNPTIAEEDRAKFNEALNQDYSLFIVRESLTGEDVNPEKLYAVTAREIQAGRMPPNHRLRILAVFGIRGLAPLLDEHPELYEDLSLGGGLWEWAR